MLQEFELNFSQFSQNMVMKQSGFFGLSCVVSSLLFLVQLYTTFASASVIAISVCGSDRLSYMNSSNHDELLFSINGNAVGRTQFCKTLMSHKANGCIIKDSFGQDFCQPDTNLGRRFLQDKAGEPKSNPELVSNPKKIGIAATGLLVLCCVFVCPCFNKEERKPPPDEVLEKKPNAIVMDRVSSSEAYSPAENAEPVPLRVPLSPSRYTSSPNYRTGPVHLGMTQIVKATKNFSESMQIGEGGFGTVYKGYLEDGRVVAIKRAKKEHFENLRKEFKSEVELLSKIDHRNLVKLLGFVDNGNERIIITEYVANGTLREHLDGVRGRILDFNQRLEIAIDVCHGLAYLHIYAEKQIIHRDVKSSNILLTNTMRAKVSDFGFAKGGPSDPNQTHISTQVKGTVGYLDPEYMRTYQLTSKSDVYSFGILLVEILTGRRPVETKRLGKERITVRWAFSQYNEGHVQDLVDPLMEEVVDVKILRKMFSLAFHCAAPVRHHRPDMKAVGEQLWVIRADYLKSTNRV